MVENLSFIDCCRCLRDNICPPHIAVPFCRTVDCEFKPQRVIGCRVLVVGGSGKIFRYSSWAMYVILIRIGLAWPTPYTLGVNEYNCVKAMKKLTISKEATIPQHIPWSRSAQCSGTGKKEARHLLQHPTTNWELQTIKTFWYFLHIPVSFETWKAVSSCVVITGFIALSSLNLSNLRRWQNVRYCLIKWHATSLGISAC